jgi:hypothetical protein
MTSRWLVLFALAASSAQGQTVPLLSNDALTTEPGRNRYLHADSTDSIAPQPARVEGFKLAPRPLPDLSGLRSLWMPSTMIRAAQPAAAQAAARRAPARAASASCTSLCQSPLPFHEAPIDADGILNRCNAGLLNPVVGLLHGLSVLSNQR